jgi:DNA-binding LacI/PurR family transcriptional regulator
MAIDREQAAGPVNFTSSDVARLAGVSRGAVSQILNGRGERFAAGTRERVFAAARSLEYEPSAAGRALARGASDIIVAVIPHLTFGSQLQDMMEVLTDELGRHGLLLVLRHLTASPEPFDRFLAGLRPAAVLALAELPVDHLRVLERRGVRLVGDAAQSQRVTVGHDAVGALQAQHLYDRGHRHLAYAYVADRREDVYGPLRAAGFAERCRDLGLEPPQEITVRLDVDDPKRHRYMKGVALPVAVGCYNDTTALVLLSEAQREGLQVPDEVALVGVDGLLLGRHAVPRLSTVVYDTTLLAQHLAARVLNSLGIAIETASNVEYRIDQGGTT